MAVADINGIKCYYEIHGKGEPLVLVGGLSSDSQTWQLALNKFKDFFEVIVFDNRACGRTQAPESSFGISILAEDTISLLEYLGIYNAHILGHSMGGYVAQEIAIDYPERVKKLILESTASYTSEINKELFTKMLHMREEKVPYDVFLREFMNWLFCPGFLKDINKVNQCIKYLEEYPYKQSLSDFKRQIEAYFAYSSLGRLKDIAARTLILRGENDLIITEKDIKALAGAISDTEVKIIKNSAHSLHIEQPDVFSNEVIRFLKESNGR